MPNTSLKDLNSLIVLAEYRDNYYQKKLSILVYLVLTVLKG